MDLVTCSTCGAVVDRGGFDQHKAWHQSLRRPRRPHCRQHTLFQPTCPICVASRAGTATLSS